MLNNIEQIDAANSQNIDFEYAFKIFISRRVRCKSNFGHYLKSMMIANNYSPVKLALQLGVHTNTVDNWLHRTKNEPYTKSMDLIRSAFPDWNNENYR